MIGLWKIKEIAMSKYYTLTKLSSPNSYQLGTHTLSLILADLEKCICSCCMIDCIKHDEYTLLSDKERVECLLETTCGAEFIFEEYDSYEHYIKQLIKEYQEE